MPRRAVATVSVLGVATVALAVTLSIVLATDDDGTGAAGQHQGSRSGGIMAAMASMDSDAMLEQMPDVLGEEG